MESREPRPALDDRTYLAADERAVRQFLAHPTPDNLGPLHAGEEFLARELFKPGRAWRVGGAAHPVQVSPASQAWPLAPLGYRTRLEEKLWVITEWDRSARPDVLM